MRPPMLFLTVAFGVGLWAGLDPFVFPGRALPGGALWIVALPVVALAAWLARRAPLGAAGGIMGVAGKVCGAWGGESMRSILCRAGAARCAMHTPPGAPSCSARRRRS